MNKNTFDHGSSMFFASRHPCEITAAHRAATTPWVMRMFPIIMAGLLVIVLNGCATYPLGLTKDQWNALPPDQQAEYQARQYEINEQRRQQQEALNRQRREQAEADARAKQDRIDRIYQNAVYGDIVRVTIQGGLLQIYKDQYRYHPVSFELARGESKSIPFTRTGRIAQTISFLVRLSEDGHSLFIDDDSHGHVVLTNLDWERGQRFGITTTGGSFNLVGATAFIKFKELPGAPNRIIIESR